MLMVMLAQFFGASMNTMTRTLQLDGAHGEGMNPFQVSSPVAGFYVQLSNILLDSLRADVRHCDMQRYIHVVCQSSTSVRSP